MTNSTLKRCSVEEFLALEEASDTRHEYYDGEVFAMAGGSAEHSLIATNCCGELRAALKSKGCHVHGSDMMVFTSSGLRTYPDASIVCDKPQFEGDKKRVLLNPIALIEVLSESTEAYDRGKKFEHYQSIESLQECVLVSQDHAHVDRFTRQENGQWLLAAYGESDGTIELPSLACSIPMAEIYRGVEFPPERPPVPDEAPLGPPR